MWALIERPYRCGPQTVGAVYDVYDRPGRATNYRGATRILTSTTAQP
jgi:hypothetical protein